MLSIAVEIRTAERQLHYGTGQEERWCIENVKTHKQLHMFEYERRSIFRSRRFVQESHDMHMSVVNGYLARTHPLFSK